MNLYWHKTSDKKNRELDTQKGHYRPSGIPWKPKITVINLEINVILSTWLSFKVTFLYYLPPFYSNQYFSEHTKLIVLKTLHSNKFYKMTDFLKTDLTLFKHIYTYFFCHRSKETKPICSNTQSAILIPSFRLLCILNIIISIL